MICMALHLKLKFPFFLKLHQKMYQIYLIFLKIAVQKIVAEVDAKIMAVALKTTTEDMKDKVVKNMSERAAEMLQDEMQYIKDLPEKDIDDAQRKVMKAVRDLESRDEITLEQEIKKDSKESVEKDDEAEID